eukprot:Rhum_TRINITY_DN2472_c0_g1::Rhum_TRINITY_DN2472_c0_g1_i1::g.7282::m.7282/K11252/H2B; histone H2B
MGRVGRRTINARTLLTKAAAKRVLALRNQGMTLRKRSVKVMNAMMWDLFDRIMSHTEQVHAAFSKKKHPDCADVIAAVKLVLPAELATYALLHARRHTALFARSRDGRYPLRVQKVEKVFDRSGVKV